MSTGTTSSRSGDHGAIQRASARLYRRLGSDGPRLLLVCIAQGVLLTLATVALAEVLGATFLHRSASDLFSVTPRILVLLTAAVLAGAFMCRHELATMMSWSGADRGPALAPDVWEAVVLLPYVGSMRVLAAGLVAVVPLAGIIVHAFHEPGYVLPEVVFAGCIAGCGATVAVVFGTELLARPMLEDIAGHLPAGFEPQARTWRLRTKALAPLPVVTMVGALVVGAFTDVVHTSHATRLAIVLGIGVVTTAVATLMFVVITRSMLDPLDDLLAATRRVRSGDITTMVPVVTADDLGTLAVSFNEMLGNLRDSQDELRASRARIVATADAERRRVERDLHDGAQQHLVLLRLKLGLLSRTVKDDPAAAAALTDQLRDDLERALSELRDLAHGIYPALLENEGLAGALAEAARRSVIPARLEADGAGRYPAELEAAVYFCCVEALQNASKHAGEAAAVEMTLAERDGVLEFAVADDGSGFDPAQVRKSAGVQNMTDRIGALGGALRIESAAGRGTTIAGRIPLVA